MSNLLNMLAAIFDWLTKRLSTWLEERHTRKLIKAIEAAEAQSAYFKAWEITTNKNPKEIRELVNSDERYLRAYFNKLSVKFDRKR